MAQPFKPRDWYWIVAGSTTQVYSSAVGDYVPVDNVSYQAWRDDGFVPTKIDSEASLGNVLAAHSLRPIPAAVLDGYTEAQAIKLTIETVAKVLVNHENRIRTLAGQTSVTAAQFKNFLKGLM